MKKIGVMGGTFDPIHNGHLVAANEVKHIYDLDEVVFVPTSSQPFKVGQEMADAEHRYLMTVIATVILWFQDVTLSVAALPILLIL